MSVSLKEVADLLRELHDSACSVRILFKDGSSNVGWERTGKISNVGLTEFEVSWDEGGSRVFLYEVLTTLDGRQPRFIYPSGDVVVVHEVVP